MAIARVAARSGSVIRSSPGRGSPASWLVAPHRSCHRLTASMPTIAAPPIAVTPTTCRPLISVPPARQSPSAYIFSRAPNGVLICAADRGRSRTPHRPSLVPRAGGGRKPFRLRPV